MLHSLDFQAESAAFALGRAAVAVSFAPSPEGKESKEPSLPQSLAKSPHRLLSGRAHLQHPATSQWQPSPGSHNRQDRIPYSPVLSARPPPPPFLKSIERDIKSFNGLLFCTGRFGPYFRSTDTYGGDPLLVVASEESSSQTLQSPHI